MHLVVGPDEHGVVLHGAQVARACGHELVRAVRPGSWPDFADADVVHVPFTDRLFGHDLDQAAKRFGQLRDHVTAAGASLSVTLHDVPHGAGTLQQRRRKLYREVVSAARGVVVNSRLELSLVEPWAETVHSLRIAPLPVLPGPGDTRRATAGDGSVAVLGFVFPDRGYEDVLAALPPGARLLALGRASDGHEDLPEQYARLAGARWSMTGYLPADELSARLLAVDVPVAPNRRVTASASINTWLAHGRRPLVPDSPYVRELVADRPGAVRVYAPDDADELRDAIGAALADPASTWLDDDIARGPSLEDVAAVYREHLDACVPPTVIEVPGGWTVPGNRWDLLEGITPQPPSVSVVIPYYRAQPQLDRTLRALAGQSLRPLQIVVADDGSDVPPDVTAAGNVSVTVVRQDDQGFRAGAARNLGAAAATGDVLVFLDADTAPEPDFVARLTALPARCPDAVTVGHRRHADFATDPPTVLDEPGWLRDAYRGSRDLLDADGRSYRYVISAVLAMRRSLFRELGGFDERIVGYGGEDWELAHRAWVAGAVFAHVPGAVAWHVGPDWAGRPEAHRPDAKQAETLALDLLVPDPEARGGGQWLPYPAVVVRMSSCSTSEMLGTARSAFATGADVGFWCEDVTGPYADVMLADPRLRQGTPPPDVLTRARWTVELTVPGRVDFAPLPAWCSSAERHGCVVAPGVVVRSARAINRARRWWPADAERYAERLFGRQDC